MVEISKPNNIARLSRYELTIEALGWIGFILLLSAVGIMVGTVALSMLFDLEYGLRLLLLGVGATLGLGGIVKAVSEFFRTSSSKVVLCTYCGMKNSATAVYCLRCDKVLPKHKRRLPPQMYPPRV